MENTFFCRKINVGEAIKPFLVSGVLEKEYTGERCDGVMDQFLNAAIQEAIDKYRDADFKEFDPFAFSGMQGQWKTVDTPAPQYADGKYYVMEHLAVMPIYLLLESDIDQEIQIKTRESRITAVLNGKVVYDSQNEELRFPKERIYKRIYVFEHNVNPNCEIMTLPLKKGSNRLLILTGHVNRSTGIQFDMQLIRAEQPIYARVPLNMPEDIRRDTFESYQRTHMIDDCFYGDDIPQFKIGSWPLSSCKVQCTINGPDGMLLDQLQIDDNGICQIPEAQKPGDYTVNITWYLDNGAVIGHKCMSFKYIHVIDPLPGYENFEKRRQYALETLAAKGNPLALYRLNRAQEINTESVAAKIYENCDKIVKRADCADFELLPLLWLMWEDKTANLISSQIKERVKHAALSFRYWIDEPETSSMFYCSENHRVGFHVCEYLAGLLYPTDFFTCCQQNGMYHSLKGRMHLVEWLSQRCKMGFDEPHSAAYLPVSLSAILCLREVLPREEYPLRNMVNVLLDFTTFIFASSNLDGYMATPQGRGYNIPARNRFASSMNSMYWMFLGNAKAAPNFNPEFAFSLYVPPKGLCNIAYDPTPVNYTFKQGLMHFDKHNADFTIRWTPDYAIGGVRDHNVGMCDMHFFTDMIYLRGDTPIFFSAPNNTAEGSGLRPDYWAGQAFLPRVLMSGRTMAVIWHNVNNPVIWMTHCHFNKRRFDEVIQKDGWTFGRKENGYVAIWSSVPHSFREDSLYAGRELIADGNETVWLAECGSKTEDGSFENFIHKILNAPICQNGETITFSSPGSGFWEFGLTDGFNINGEPVPISDFLVDSPYLTSKFGSGKFDYTCKDFTVTHWTYPASV